MTSNIPSEDVDPASDSFNATMRQLRDGDAAACRAVFDRYVHRLVALARSRLDPQLRSKEDPEDVVQSVFRSFFQRYGDGRLEVSNWENLWAMLALLTRRKCSGRSKFYHAGRRDVGREAASLVLEDHSAADWQPDSADPSPEEGAVLGEMIEVLLADFPEPKHQRIILLTLQGVPADEVSTTVPCTERMVHRVLAKVRDWLLLHGQE